MTHGVRALTIAAVAIAMVAGGCATKDQGPNLGPTVYQNLTLDQWFDQLQDPVPEAQDEAQRAFSEMPPSLSVPYLVHRADDGDDPGMRARFRLCPTALPVLDSMNRVSPNNKYVVELIAHIHAEQADPVRRAGAPGCKW